MERVAPLRDDISLLEGPFLEGGQPSWVLVDEAANTHFQLLWRDVEIFKRWALRDVRGIAWEVCRDTSLNITIDDIMVLNTFLQNNGLLRVGAQSIQAARNAQKEQAAKHSDLLVASKLLFPKVPLFNPQSLLRLIGPLFGFVFFSAFWTFLGGMAFVGGGLVMLSPHRFFAAPEAFLTLENGIVALLCLVVSKIIHEFGHGIAAHRYGVRVPVMGVAFVAFVPLAYSDVNDAWRLSSRRQRVNIVLGGLGGEAILAVGALVMWSFLPVGALQFACFFLAAIVFPLSLVLNFNPFMKFDGYYIATELLQVDTLQERGGAYFKHCTLRFLLGARAGATPEATSGLTIKRTLFWYGFGALLNRVVVLFGVGLMIGAAFGGQIGLIAFVAVLGVFLLKPFVLSMARVFGQLEGGIGLRGGVAGVGFACLLALAFLPYRTSYHAPASATFGIPIDMYAPHDAQVTDVMVQVGEHVEAGQVLFSLVSPDLEVQAQQLATRANALRMQQVRGTGAQALREQSRVIDAQIAQVAQDLQDVARKLDSLAVKAPVSGRVEGVAEGLASQRWFGEGQKVLRLVTRTKQPVYAAYLDERVRDILDGSVGAQFWSEAMPLHYTALHEVEVDELPVASISMPQVVSRYGGSVAAKTNGNGRFVPDYAHYKATLFPVFDDKAVHVGSVGQQSGYIRYQTKPRSFARRVAHRVGGVFAATLGARLW